MSHVIYKNIARQPVWADGGAGVWLHGRDGARYLDTCGGVAVSSLGHNHPRVAEAVARAAKELTWAHAGSFTTSPAEELAELLAEQSGGLTRVQFLSGGSEAMELAIKTAYQYHCERSQPQRTVLISRRQSYHGSTLGMLSVSGNVQRRSIFEPLLSPAEFVAPCYEYRDRQPGQTQEQYAQHLADELEERIKAVGSHRVAAFIAETVVGSTSGAVPAVPGYLAKMLEVCRRHGVLLVLDEVMAGMGRTGHPYAYLEDGIVPDIVAVGKGLAAGAQPISAVLVSQQVHEALEHGSGVLRNGQTHVNHPLACAVALEVQRTIADEGLLTAVLERGAQLRRLLLERFAANPCVGDVRGRGLFLGVEFVGADGRSPHTGGVALAGALKAEGLARGLLLYPGWGTVDGAVGNHVLFAPPFISLPSHIEEMVHRFGQVVDHVLSPSG